MPNESKFQFNEFTSIRLHFMTTFDIRICTRLFVDRLIGMSGIKYSRGGGVQANFNIGQ